MDMAPHVPAVPCYSGTSSVVSSKGLSCSNARSLLPRKCAPNLLWPRLQREFPKLITGWTDQTISSPCPAWTRPLSPGGDRQETGCHQHRGGADGDALNLRDLSTNLLFSKVIFVFVLPACSTNRLRKHLVDIPVEMSGFIYLRSCPRVSRFLHSACPYIHAWCISVFYLSSRFVNSF